MPPGGATFSNGETRHFAFEFQVLQFSFMGRAAAKTRGVSRAEKTAQRDGAQMRRDQPLMKHNGKTSARQQYRVERDSLVKGSPSLAEKYRGLKSLKVRLAYCNPEGTTRGTEIKYDVNL